MTIQLFLTFVPGSNSADYLRPWLLVKFTGVCSYVQKHVIDALEGFSQFLANEVSKVRNIAFVIVFIFGFINCNVVLLDANTANFGSTSLALTASIFALSTYIGIVIVNSVLCRKNPECLHSLSLAA